MSDDKQEELEQPTADSKAEEILDADAQPKDEAEGVEMALGDEETSNAESSTGASETASLMQSEDGEGASDADAPPVGPKMAIPDSDAPPPMPVSPESKSDDGSSSLDSDEAMPPPLPATSEVRIQSSAARREAAFIAFPVHKDHGTARRMVVDSVDTPVDLAPAKSETNGTQNLLAVILIVAVSAVGLWQLSIVSSEEVLAAKRAEREAMEEQFLAEQMAKQKRYGVLRIESVPAQATVIKDGESIVVAPTTAGEEDGTPPTGADPAAGVAPAASPTAGVAPGTADGGSDSKPRAGTTPMNLMNIDIGSTYKFKVTKEGYEPFEFAVAEHLWTKDAGEYKFIKMIELIPINCEYWFLYDAKKRREVQFEQKLGCMDHYKKSVASMVSVTECACKLPPPEAAATTPTK